MWLLPYGKLLWKWKGAGGAEQVDILGSDGAAKFVGLGLLWAERPDKHSGGAEDHSRAGGSKKIRRRFHKTIVKETDNAHTTSDSGRRCDVRVYVHAALVMLSVSFASVMAQQRDLSHESQASLYSVEKELALGRQLASEVRRRTRAIEDASIDAYVAALGLRLSGAMPGPGVSFTFSVIADDPCPITHEPASLPGGYVFVPAALFLKAQNEAEFAGMLAHSMAHVAARHATRQASEAKLANAGTIPLIFLGGLAGSCTEGKGLAIPRGLQVKQHSDELDADRIAVAAMARSGFDPSALANYVQRVQRDTGRSKQLSQEPALDERVAAMNLLIRKLSVSIPEETQSDFLNQQRKVRSLIQ